MSDIPYYIAVLDRSYYYGTELLGVSKSFNNLIPVLNSWIGSSNVYAYEITENSEKIIGRFSYINRMSKLKLFTNYSHIDAAYVYPKAMYIMVFKEKPNTNFPIRIRAFSKFSDVVETFVEHGLGCRTEIYTASLDEYANDYTTHYTIGISTEDGSLFYAIGKEGTLQFIEAFKNKGLEVPSDLTRNLKKYLGA